MIILGNILTPYFIDKKTEAWDLYKPHTLLQVRKQDLELDTEQQTGSK